MGKLRALQRDNREGLKGFSQLCNVSLASHRFTGTCHVLQCGTAIILPRVWLPLECRIPISWSQSTLLDLIQLEDEWLHLEEVVQSGFFWGVWVKRNADELQQVQKRKRPTRRVNLNFLISLKNVRVKKKNLITTCCQMRCITLNCELLFLVHTNNWQTFTDVRQLAKR